jgi:peptidoglycan/xylan/chitin deacetylase (PgdA/CDA1 family)
MLSIRSMIPVAAVAALAVACGGVPGDAPSADPVAPVGPSSVVVQVSPKDTSVAAGSALQFASAVTGSTIVKVTWSIQEGSPSGGTISTGGLYTAPSGSGTFHVVATAVADPTKSGSATVVVAPPCSGADTLRYAIARPATPVLTYRDLTLKVNVGGATGASVTVDGLPVASVLDGSGALRFTTTGDAVAICLTGANPSAAGFGSVTKAVLKNDKKWAWSHGFDDNVNFKLHALDAFRSRGWAASVFIIGNAVMLGRNESWIIDDADIRTLASQGWGIGNHTWSHDTVAGAGGASAAKADIVKDYDLLRSIVDGAKAGYRMIAFAAPMFDSDYQAVINDIRDNDPAHQVQFNESGNDYMPQVDPGVFDRKATLGRDPGIEGAGSGNASYDSIPTVNRIHAQADATHHYWYNTLIHGCDNQYPSTGFFYFIQYVYSNYGPGGTDEVWVAPSDQVYSYLVTRDGSVVTRQ